MRVISVMKKLKVAWQLLIFFFYMGSVSLETHESQDIWGRGRSFLTPLYHFQPFHKHLGINWAITTEDSPMLIIASDMTRTRNLRFPSSSH